MDKVCAAASADSGEESSSLIYFIIGAGAVVGIAAVVREEGGDSEESKHSDLEMQSVETYASDDRPAAQGPYHVFLTHDWGKDAEGRDNHKRVSKINKALKERGLITWFDEDRMEGSIVDAMIAVSTSPASSPFASPTTTCRRSALATRKTTAARSFSTPRRQSEWTA